MRTRTLLAHFILLFSLTTVAANNELTSLIEKWVKSIEEQNYEDYISCFHSYMKNRDDRFGEFFTSKEVLQQIASKVSKLKKDDLLANFNFEYVPVGPGEAPTEWGDEIIVGKLLYDREKNRVSDSFEVDEVIFASDQGKLAILGYRLE